MMYSYKTRIPFSEVGKNMRLTLPSLLTEFQDCALFHAEDVGQGAKTLRAEGHIWLLASWQIVIDHCPSMYEEVTVATWPYRWRGFFGYRNFTMTGADGQLEAWANSIWVYTDLKTGHPVKAPAEVCDPFGTDPMLEMEIADRRITVPDGGKAMEPIPVRKSDIDSNLHVNNERYVLIAQEFLPDGFVTRQLRAEYKKEAYFGDVLYPTVASGNGVITVALDDADGKPYAITEFAGRAA